MPYVIETLLFLLPFAAYALWRRLHPGTEPATVLLALAAAGVVLMVGGAVWYGQSRSLAPGEDYRPAQFRDGRITPGDTAR